MKRPAPRKQQPTHAHQTKVRQKSIPVISLTGQPPAAQQAWWSKRFLEVLESFRLGSRLARGKAYAQENKVMKLSISSGIVQATVQGSRKSHYRVTIKLTPLSDAVWRQVMHNLTKKAIFAVEMLQDKMPQDIEEVFAAGNTSLFPSQLNELESECDCPDWSNPCKHIAAVYYVLAQHFDLDPFLIFVWRGRLKTQILEYLRHYWRQGKPRTQAFGPVVPRLQINDDDSQAYWHGKFNTKETRSLDPFSDAVPDSGIKKLGEAPVQLDGKELGAVLAEAYAHTSEGIRGWALNQPSKPKLATGS